MKDNVELTRMKKPRRYKKSPKVTNAGIIANNLYIVILIFSNMISLLSVLQGG